MTLATKILARISEPRFGWRSLFACRLCSMGIAVLLVSPVFGASHVSDRARRIAASFIEREQVPGLAITVALKRDMVWSGGVGYADLEQGVRVQPGLTRFRVGSVSKPMTAMAVARLYERRQLELDQEIQVYVPQFPRKSGRITTRLLAGHLGGIRHYQGDEMLSNQPYSTVSDALEIFKGDPLVHAPGLKFHYSSYGWNLVSAVVEGASQRAFLDVMQEEVFEPLGMKHTIADHVATIIPHRTRFYELFEGQIRNAPSVDNSYKWAGGGFLSTTEDLVIFAHSHLYPRHLKAETVALLWRPQLNAAGESTDYGLGWGSGSEEIGGSWVGHNGGSIGGTTRLRIYPEKELVIAVAANRAGVGLGALVQDLLSLWLTTKEP